MGFFRVFLAFLLCAALAPAQRRKAHAVQVAASSYAVSFRDVKLKNGLRVILSEDHSAPTYSIAVTYNVGSRDERPSRSGFAHLFEHMMFQGSENVGKGEHFILIQNYGGSMNGTTNSDRTNYFEALPANQMDLGLFLEADRMRSLAINQANLDNQRNAVQEERRLRVDNRPYGRTLEALGDLGYDSFGYKHSTIGSMEDLNAATVQEVAEFFKIYYAPNNAALALVGDFDTETALTKVRRYFEEIPAQKPAPAPEVAESDQTAERRKTIEDPFAMTPRIDVAYKVPPAHTPDWYALSVLSRILGGGATSGSGRRGSRTSAAGGSSRLYQRLVRDKEAAVMVSCSATERRGPSQEVFLVMARPGWDTGEIEKLLYGEIERVKNEPVTDDELARARIQLRRQHVQSLESTLSRATALGQLAVCYNDPGLINTELDKLQSVTKDDIQRVARTYLKPANRTVIITVPKGKAS
jgi:predicted Zn-dependent peptidase